MQSLLKQRPPRKFICDFRDCGKSFTRAEHLQRHKLNHRDSPNTCTRCCAHFARPDLLERHMERHAQKDKEAGGQGLGVLITRKRCWRDENGNITTKRPASSVAVIGKALEAQQQRRGYSSDEGGSGSGTEGVGGPISPPYSSGSSNGGSTHSNFHDEQAVGVVDFRHSQNEQQLNVHNQHISSDGFLEVPAAPEYQLGPSTPDITTPVNEIPASFQADFEDLFSACAAKGVSKPFTTPNGYNWPLEGLSVPSTQETICVQFGQNIGKDTDQVNTVIPTEPIYGGENQLLCTPTNEHGFLNFGPQSQHQQEFIQQDFQSLEPLEQRPAEVSLEPHAYFPGGPTSTILQVPRVSHANPASTCQQSSLALGDPHSQQHTYTISLPPQYPHSSPHPSGSHCSQTASILGIPGSLQHPLPEIDEVTRQQALELIIQATTSPATGESQFGWDDPLLSLSALQNYSDLFFTRFNASYTLIHRESFDPSSVNTLLLVSVLMLGAAYGEKDAHQMAVRVHDVLRRVLVSSYHLYATPELWMLQTFFLEVFGESRAGMKQNDIAHLFHELLNNV